MQDPGAGRLAVMAGEDPPSGSEAAPSWSVLTWWRVKEVLWGIFYKGTTPIHEGSTLVT